MRFKVIPPSRTAPKLSQPGFVIMQDAWNDFGFQTQYILYWCTPDTQTRIGIVKILRRGQVSADALQIKDDFDVLDDRYVSVGETLDYYQHLSELGVGQRNEILDSLRDVARHPALEDMFNNEEGWKKSVFRGQTEDGIREHLMLARALVNSDYTSIPEEDLKFSFRINGAERSIDFDFSEVSYPSGGFFNTKSLPDRLIVLIGRNGSGKSTLLARLARVAHGSASKRDEGAFDQLGRMEPVGIGFPRIITVSYSAFDSFALPGVAPRPDREESDERSQIVQDARRGEGRFVFCGLRDIASELEDQIVAQPVRAWGEGLSDSVEVTKLKAIDTLATEFSQTLQLIKDKDRTRIFDKAMSMVITDPSLSHMDDIDLTELHEGEAQKLFMSWSTGHKITIQIIANLCAYVVPRSLVLIDEPETHLHPPLLAVLMHAIRLVLKKFKAFGIVATHSPVLLQETLARDVFVVRRDVGLTAVSRPPVETFGENVGAITREVFGLNSEVTDFHKILDQLVASVGEMESIEKLFDPYGLSLQARAYVMSRLASLKKEG